MKNYPLKLTLLLAIFLLIGSISGQTADLPPLDESQFSEPDPNAAPQPEATAAHDSVVQPAPAPTPAPSSANEKTKPAPDLGPEPELGPEPDLTTTISDDGNAIKNAIIDGVQVSSEPGEKPGEKVVTCYFIFQDKPSSYFYEVKVKEKKIVFEFNDTKKSDAPINFESESPIKDFTIEHKQINVNKEIKGLKAEFHNQIRVTFNLTAVPKIQVSDEFNVISFAYKWNSDPAKQEDYIVVSSGPKTLIWSAAGVGTVGTAALIYFLNGRGDKAKPNGPLPIDDLPSVPNSN